ncbi:MAG: WbqC family protein [Candidatus Hodarchaeales archaeon]
MQPYFFPYIGYFQLIYAVDKFIVYDTVSYIKHGWIKRNQYLLNDKVKYFSLSIHEASSHKLINNSFIAEEEQYHSKEKVLKTIYMAYARAPYFDEIIPLIESLILNEEQNISRYNSNILQNIARYLKINTEILICSQVLNTSSLTGQERVIEICENFQTDHYINPIGGIELYDKTAFDAHGIKLSFLKSDASIVYRQWDETFYPNLSIIDVMMFNPVEKIASFLNQYKLI